MVIKKVLALQRTNQTERKKTCPKQDKPEKAVTLPANME